MSDTIVPNIELKFLRFYSNEQNLETMLPLFGKSTPTYIYITISIYDFGS